MRQSRRNIFIILAGIAVLVFAWELFKPREPSYQGKTLTEWLKIPYEDNTKNIFLYPEEPSEAADAVRHIGKDAIPTLLKLAATKDSKIQGLLHKFSEKLDDLTSVNLRLKETTNQFEIIDPHYLAMEGFFILGRNSKPAIPKLTALLDSENADVRDSALQCLSAIGPAAEPSVPDLVKLLEADEAKGFTGARIVDALGSIAPSARGAIPALMKVLALTNDWRFKEFRWQRTEARAALIKMQAASLYPILDQLKNTSDLTNWIDASVVVGECSTNAGTAAAIPLLINALSQTNRGIQFCALNALGNVHQRPEMSIPALIPFLESTNSGIRSQTVAIIRRFYKDARPAVPALIRCLNDPDFFVRRNATNALRAIDPEAAAKAGIK